MHTKSLLSLGLMALANGALAQNMRSLLLNPELEWSVRTDITFPEDGDVFENATERWSIYSAPTYVAAITPGGEADVVQAVRLARENNIEFLATGGRHGYVGGFGRLKNGLAIDLSNLNQVEIDVEAATLTIGGGVRARDVVHPVSDAGFELPLGGCSCPGLVGVTIGGGITNWLGNRGLIIDALLSARIVTASGEIVEASADVNPELFWGIKGAGANFGIIVSATYQLFPQTPSLLIVDTAWPVAMNESYFAALEQVATTWAPGLSMNTLAVWDQGTNQTMIMGNFHYMGPTAEGLAFLAPLLDLNPPVMEVHEIPWDEYHHTTLFGRDAQNCNGGTIHNPYGAMARNFSRPVLNTMLTRMTDLYNKHPSTRASAAVFHTYSPEAAIAHGDDSSAYAWRDASIYMYILLAWTPGDEAAETAGTAAAAAIRDEFAANSGYEGLASYMNFGHGDESLEQIYSPRKLPRLAALKNQYDPENRFKFQFPLPTSYP